MVNNVYGEFRKSYEPFTVETTIKTIDELMDELLNGFKQLGINQNDYKFRIIHNEYKENGVIPVWTLAIKATPIKGESK